MELVRESLLYAMAAELLMSALTIVPSEMSSEVNVPSAILADVTELSARSLVPIVPSLIFEEITELPARSDSPMAPSLTESEEIELSGGVKSVTSSFLNVAVIDVIDADETSPPKSAPPKIAMSPSPLITST